MRTILIVALIGAALAVPALLCQDSPYTDHVDREIKALSSEEIEGYLAGAGMGFAMAAELNRFPGPKHVLEHRQALELTAEQAERVEQAYAEMSREATRLGKELVEAERELDRLFALGQVSEESLARAVHGISALRGRLRFAHLVAHLEVTKVLTERQIEQYEELRGYSGAHSSSHGDLHDPSRHELLPGHGSSGPGSKPEP